MSLVGRVSVGLIALEPGQRPSYQRFWFVTLVKRRLAGRAACGFDEIGTGGIGDTGLRRGRGRLKRALAFGKARFRLGRPVNYRRIDRKVWFGLDNIFDVCRFVFCFDNGLTKNAARCTCGRIDRHGIFGLAAGL